MLYGNSSIQEKQFSSPSDQKSSRFRTGNPNRLLAGSIIERLEPEDLINLIFNNYGEEVGNFDTATAGWVRYSR